MSYLIDAVNAHDREVLGHLVRLAVATASEADTASVMSDMALSLRQRAARQGLYGVPADDAAMLADIANS